MSDMPTWPGERKTLVERFDLVETALVDATIAETGFTVRDSQDLIAGARTVIAGLTAQIFQPEVASTLADRRLTLNARPYGGVAVVLPLNAFPYMAFLSGLGALLAGNRVWLKAPSGCAQSAALVRQVFGSTWGDQVQLVATPGREFINWALGEPKVDLIHFIGGSEAGSTYLKPAFDAGKALLIDGDGNCQVYVGASADSKVAAKLLASAATRFNGQTCTSATGAVVHPDVFDMTVKSLSRHFEDMACGDPRNPATSVGPLSSESAAEHTLDLVHKTDGTVLVGGDRTGALVEPTLLADPDPASDLVRRGAFGPVLWVKRGNVEDFEEVWNTNCHPLCAGVLSQDPAEADRLSRLRSLSRLTVNGDTSIEDPLEPWGGCPSSGNGKVEQWIARYQRTVQLDLPRT